MTQDAMCMSPTVTADSTAQENVCAAHSNGRRRNNTALSTSPCCQSPSLNGYNTVPRPASPLYSHRAESLVANPARDARSESITTDLASSSTLGSVPRYWSLFYPAGVTAQSPPLLHYLLLHGWRTVAGGRDYYSHRRLRPHETRGHTVRWLHNAQPKGSFVFLVDPVEPVVRTGRDDAVASPRRADTQDTPPTTSATSVPPTSPREARGPTWRRALRWHPWRSSQTAPAFAHRRRRRGECAAAESAIEESDIEAMTATTWAAYAVRQQPDSGAAVGSVMRDVYCSPATHAHVLRPGTLTDTPLSGALCHGAGDTVARPYLGVGPQGGKKAAQDRHRGGEVRWGAEAVVISHADVTALDYLPGLVNSRLSIEARVVQTYYFPSVEAAMGYYGYDPCGCPSPRLDLSPSRRGAAGGTATELFSVGCTPILGPCANPAGLMSGAAPQLVSRHTDTVLSIYTADPNFNAVLRELLIPEPGTHPYTTDLATQRRLLSLYEAGMPRWASLVAAAGMPYRRVLRLGFVLLVNAWPLVSLGVGFYDLYRHLPQLKRFLSHTIDPVARWVDRRVTVRVSMLVTYLVSVALNIFASLSSFFSPFFVLHRVTLPLIELGYRIVRLPFVLFFETLWSILSISYAFFSLLLVTARVVLVGPCELLTRLYAMRGAIATTAAEVPAASSVTMQWLGAWQEFWVTIASPLNNIAKAVYNSLQHFALLVLRREESIRRLCGPTLTRVFAFFTLVGELVVVNAHIWTELLLPGCVQTLALFFVISYLYWFLILHHHATAMLGELDVCATQVSTCELHLS